MYHFNCFILERHIEILRRVSREAEVPIGELVRRILDDNLHACALDRLLPCMSGHWSLEPRR